MGMKVAVVLFENFETLDVFGPVEVLGRLPECFAIDYYSLPGGVQTSTQGVKVDTRSLEELTVPVGILLIPGGKGTRTEIGNQELITCLTSLGEISYYVLTVCTGSALLAKTKLLDYKKATSNKRAWEWVISTRQEVKWQKKARWTVDGKYYTSSGISAGIDMSLGFVSDLLGPEKAHQVAIEMEYNWNSDSENDPFAAFTGVE